MRLWPRRKIKLQPDLDAFHAELIHSTYGKNHAPDQIARDFRQVFLSEPERGKRVLFALLTWCGEYGAPPEGNDQLQRWAGQREVADRIKTALHADLSAPPQPDTKDEPR